MSELDRRTLLKLGAVGLGAAALGPSAREGTAEEPQLSPEPEIPQRDPYTELAGIIADNTVVSRQWFQFENEGRSFEMDHSVYDEERASVHVRIRMPHPEGYEAFGGFSVNKENFIPFGFVRHGEVFSGMDTSKVHLLPRTPEERELSFLNAVALSDFVQANLPQK